MRLFSAVMAMVSMAAVTGPGMAGDAKGVVKEIIIKVETPDGPRWYSLGAGLSKIDVSKGAVIRFNYADDTIEGITVEKPKSGDRPKTKSE